MEDTNHPEGGDPTFFAEAGILHEFRKQIDACIKQAEALQCPGLSYGRELSLVRTKLQEAKMWAGKCLEFIPNNEFPENLKDEATQDKR